MTNNTPTRLPIAREFYSGNCLQQIRSFITGFEIPENYPDKFIGAVIPHAGWCYSGQTTARTLYCVSKRSDPEFCIIFGADHSGISKHSILPKGFWDTPLGVIPIAEKLCDKIIKTLPNFLSVDIKAQNREHSIEVCAPMVRYFFPKIQIIPIIVRPKMNSLELGKQVAIIVKNMGKSAIVLASSDLTHYGDYYGLTPAGLGDSGFLWMKTNDLRIINCMLSCDKDVYQHKTHETSPLQV